MNREIITNLIFLGFNDADRKVMAVMLDNKYHTQSEIEELTELHQPNVSVALKHLIQLELIIKSESDLKPERGRPINNYKINWLWSSIIRSWIINEASLKHNAIYKLIKLTGSDVPSTQKPDN